MTHTFHNDIADVQVASTMEALGDQPWHCTVQPKSDFPVFTVIIETTYPLIAACEAVNRFKAEHHIENLSGVWTF